MDKHPLATWMAQHPDISQSKLADVVACSEGHLSLVLQRKRGVSMRLAKRLSDATNGAVSVESFLQEDREAAQ